MEILKAILFILNEMSPYILLGFLIAGVMHAFIPQSMFMRHLSGADSKTVVKAALFGVPLPLCSCGVLPTAIGMRRNGGSKAATTSFLIATPQTGVDSISATWSLLGPAFAIIRPVAALVTAVAGGIAVGRHESKENSTSGQAISSGANHSGHSHNDSCETVQPIGFGQKCLNALSYGFVDLVGSIGFWLVVGLIIAAVITVYVPADYLAVLGEHPIIAMIAVLLIAIPMYVCATGSIPIAMSLVLKGLSPGTAFVLLMAGPAANFASFTLISRELGKKTALIYLSTIIVGALAFGILIDYFLPKEWFNLSVIGAAGHTHHHFSIFSLICSAVLVALLIYSALKRKLNNNKIESEMAKEYLIKGMNCPHCQASVTKAINGVAGVSNVVVNLSSGHATVEGEHNPQAVLAAVSSAGFDASEI